jgi:hypothetical protein
MAHEGSSMRFIVEHIRSNAHVCIHRCFCSSGVFGHLITVQRDSYEKSPLS